MTELQYSLAAPTVPGKPPTRIYVGDLQYRLVGPRVSLPGLPGLAKVILNWSTNVGTIAKNILHVFLSGGADPTDISTLQAIANGVKAAVTSSNMLQSITSGYHLDSVTAKDASGTSENIFTTTSSVLGGMASGNPLAPQSAVCWSWSIAASYRGGKPRTYLPGIPQSALSDPNGAAITPTYATALEGYGVAFKSAVNSITVSPSGIELGSPSYFLHNAVRPTPIFFPFLACTVHERVDSQRRRSGKESSYGHYP